MMGNEKDCICSNKNNKHTKYCDAYRLSEFFKKSASIIYKNKSNIRITCTLY